MTNKEILQADLLDILFEHRNKLYGAYALRKTYTHRLGLALGGALSIVLLFVFMSFINKKNDDGDRDRNRGEAMQLTDVNLVEPEEPDPIKPKPEVKPPQATVDYQPPKIVEDYKVTEDLPEVDDIDKAKVGDKNMKGDASNDIVEPKGEATGTGNNPVKEPEVDNTPLLPGKAPSFPGGPQAWLAFLQRYLQAPEDLEPGQRIEVLVRFIIDVDGSISKPEIIKSGGTAFDREVLRVLKKMPRWEPGVQGGHYISMAYTQPVTFLGVEQ